MPPDEPLDRLSRELNRHSLGPVEAVVSTTMSRLNAARASLVAGLRQAAYDQPLITLLLACQLGYIIARLGRRYARHSSRKNCC